MIVLRIGCCALVRWASETTRRIMFATAGSVLIVGSGFQDVSSREHAEYLVSECLAYLRNASEIELDAFEPLEPERNALGLRARDEFLAFVLRKVQRHDGLRVSR